eukprot:11803888-Karenia_brevis.AAC.1
MADVILPSGTAAAPSDVLLVLTSMRNFMRQDSVNACCSKNAESCREAQQMMRHVIRVPLGCLSWCALASIQDLAWSSSLSILSSCIRELTG